jgi:hypothetical protein
MYGSTTWSYEDQLDRAITDAGLHIVGRFGDLARSRLM